MFLSEDERKVVMDAIAGENANTLFKAHFSTREGVLITMCKITKPEPTDVHVKSVQEWRKLVSAGKYHDDLNDRYR